jgi:hypothetical protein
MSKRKKSIGALNEVMGTGAEMLAEGLGGIAGSYVQKVGTYSPVVPDQAGAIAAIAVGGAIKVFMRKNLGNNFGGGLVAVGFADLAKSFGIGGVEIINGTIDKDKEAQMIADYHRRKAVNGQIINGDIINGLMRDNAVSSDKDLY